MQGWRIKWKRNPLNSVEHEMETGVDMGNSIYSNERVLVEGLGFW